MTEQARLSTRLADQFESYRVLLDGLAEPDLRQRPDSGKWSALEHVAHLGRYHEIFLQRLKGVVAGSDARLRPYRAEDDPSFSQWTERHIGEIYGTLRFRRTALQEFFDALPPDGWSTTGVHPVYGPMPLTALLHFFLVHEGHHLYLAYRAGAGARAGRAGGA